MPCSTNERSSQKVEFGERVVEQIVKLKPFLANVAPAASKFASFTMPSVSTTTPRRHSAAYGIAAQFAPPSHILLSRASDAFCIKYHCANQARAHRSSVP